MSPFKYKESLIAVLAVVLLYVFMGAIGISCPIKYITGVSCAGCGMTRAWIHLLSGDIRGAFYFHPLVLVPVPAAIILMFHPFSKKMNRIIIGVFVALFILVYIIRLIHTDDDIVVIKPENGLMYKVFNHFIMI